MFFYRAAIDLSRATLNYVAGVLWRHREAIRSPWRLLSPGRQVLLVLVRLRKGETFAEAGAGAGVSTSTAYLPENCADIYARCDDANRRRCNQAFFTKIYVDEDDQLRVENNRPFEMLLDPDINANALTWAADADKARRR